MVVLVDVTISADDFALGHLLDEFPGIDIEIERIVPLADGVMPLVWVGDAPLEEVEATIREDSLTNDAAVISEADGRALFEIQWSSEINGLIQSMIATDADVLFAEGDEDEWEFRIQFMDGDDLSAFRDRCSENGVGIELRRRYDPEEFDRDRSLTDAQHEFLEAALRGGYWDIPRENTLGEIAEREGISTNAASQRLRRGIKPLVENVVLRDH